MPRQAQAHMDAISQELPRWEDQPYVQELCRRILDGSEKLWKRWAWMGGLPSDQYGLYLEGWDRALDKLQGLGVQLTMLGYRKCLKGSIVFDLDTCPQSKSGHLCFYCPVKVSEWSSATLEEKP